MEWAKEEPFFIQENDVLKRGFELNGITVQTLF
jgi:hypothetical protein